MTDIAFWVGVADLETPVGAFLKLAHGQANSFLLESIGARPLFGDRHGAGCDLALPRRGS
jgi:hypothetical protein